MTAAQQERVYLDVCVLCRPFDDQTAMRIRLETDAYYLIMQAIQDHDFQLIVSPVHREEVKATKDPQERHEVLSVLNSLGSEVACKPETARERAEELYSQGFGVADAAHAAFAELAADYFVTCDDRLLKKSKRELSGVHAMNPVEFCLEKELR